MQKKTSHWLIRGSFLLSLLLHVLLLSSMSIAILVKPITNTQERPPQVYIPSYIYTGAITPSHTAKAQPVRPITKQAMQNTQQEQATSIPQQSIEHISSSQPVLKSFFSKSNTINQKSILEMSRDILRKEGIENAMKNLQDEEPILMIGDKNKIADPLIKLIGRSLSAHFKYPEMEGNFGITGKVLVEMILHPEGYFSDIHIVRSSDNDHLDAAALYAVNTAPTVVGVEKLLTKPKHLIVGFIFD